MLFLLAWRKSVFVGTCMHVVSLIKKKDILCRTPCQRTVWLHEMQSCQTAWVATRLHKVHSYMYILVALFTKRVFVQLSVELDCILLYVTSHLSHFTTLSFYRTFLSQRMNHHLMTQHCVLKPLQVAMIYDICILYLHS